MLNKMKVSSLYITLLQVKHDLDHVRFHVYFYKDRTLRFFTTQDRRESHFKTTVHIELNSTSNASFDKY